MWKSNVMNIFHIISHGLAEWSHTTRYSNFVIRHHFSQFPFECKNKKSSPCVAKNTTAQHGYCYAVVSSWTINHLDFQKLAGLWLGRLINSHVRIDGSNVAEGFSAFQRRSGFIFFLFWWCIFEVTGYIYPVNQLVTGTATFPVNFTPIVIYIYIYITSFNSISFSNIICNF